MRIDFYKITMPNGGGTFEAILEAVRQSDDDELCARGWSGDHFRLQQLSSRIEGRYLEGEIIRIRPEEPTTIGDTSGHVHSLQHPENEGPCSETAFRYDCTTKVLAIQCLRAGVTAANLAKYCEVFANLGGAIVASIVPNINEANKLGRMRYVKEYTLKLASIDNPTLVVARGPDSTQAVQLLRESRVPKIGITMSLGHGPKGRSLGVADVIDSARRFFGMQSSHTDGGSPIQVDAVQLFGEDENHSPIQVHMLKLIMNENRRVDKGADKRLSYDDRRDAIRDAWATRQSDIETLYPIE